MGDNSSDTLGLALAYVIPLQTSLCGLRCSACRVEAPDKPSMNATRLVANWRHSL